ncbi:flagellin N-terminal helical domain-containing protein [Rubrivivax gelatinosus]|uniref:flagellin N-terminal helical domain-containing protein n=1 Tax=Rubrivivax gelatinosus TaxID=28068 RepID=UPI0002F05A96|nr:flagellin FliC [Rubrivivax gelatinosus]
MPSTINTNLASLNAQRNLSASQSSLATSMQRLSSGLRVNSAKDDAAGLAIAERMNAQVRGMTVAARNANDGISLAQTAEGALGKVGDSLQRMRELAVQARNASNSNADKDSLDKEFGELAKEIQRVLGGTTFNGKHILASEAGSLTFQVGANTTTDDTIDVITTNLTGDATITSVAGTDNIGTGRSKIDSSATTATIKTVIDALDKAIDSRCCRCCAAERAGASPRVSRTRPRPGPARRGRGTSGGPNCAAIRPHFGGSKASSDSHNPAMSCRVVSAAEHPDSRSGRWPEAIVT